MAEKASSLYVLLDLDQTVYLTCLILYINIPYALEGLVSTQLFNFLVLCIILYFL